ncbi:MAG: NAD(P)H-dependent oxidoreductase subunit E [Pedosphaera sp.]|nr:NAD(P)H-dependent oxidoreductase subunit E [Pedosphaera sp.]
MSFTVPTNIEVEIDELITHYPVKRSASLMLLHAIQEHFGHVSREAIEWVALKLGLQPINIYELVTFYPMFRQEPLGKTHVKVCRTLSCSLAGSGELRDHFCRKLGLDSHKHGPQTTPDGKFTVEFVECLADCGNAPVVLVNDELQARVTTVQADEIIEKMPIK